MDIADLWFVLAIVGFFGLCVALVLGCDRIIGPDEDFPEALDETDTPLVASDGAR